MWIEECFKKLSQTHNNNVDDNKTKKKHTHTYK